MLEEQSKTPIAFVVGYPRNWGKRLRYIDIDRFKCEVVGPVAIWLERAIEGACLQSNVSVNLRVW